MASKNWGRGARSTLGETELLGHRSECLAWVNYHLTAAGADTIQDLTTGPVSRCLSLSATPPVSCWLSLSVSCCHSLCLILAHSLLVLHSLSVVILETLLSSCCTRSLRRVSLSACPSMNEAVAVIMVMKIEKRIVM